MSAEAWIALCALAVAVLGSMLHYEHRLSTIQADVRWLIAHAKQRRGDHEQNLCEPD